MSRKSEETSKSVTYVSKSWTGEAAHRKVYCLLDLTGCFWPEYDLARDDTEEDAMKRRPIARLPESNEKTLRSYALAAGAAGVGALALAMPSEAKIIYKPKHVKLAQGVPFYLDF